MPLLGTALFTRCFQWVSYRQNHTPGPYRVFDELVCLCNLIQPKPCGNPKPLAPCLKRLIYSVRGFNLCLGRYVVTADKENSGIAKDQLPEGDFRRESICGISGDGTALR
jgi:hypothetical protein